MKTTIVIPTYWGRPEDEPFNPNDVVYDHPTPLDQPGTLRRCLDSFSVLDRADFQVVVIAAATHPELETSVADKVASIVEPYRETLNLTLITPALVAELRGVMEREVGEEVAALVDGYGYSNIRNLCLIAGCGHGAEIVILIDDDEVIEYPEFLDRARDFMDGAGAEKPVLAKAGWYMRPDGGYKGPATRDAWWMAWQGAEAMNAGFDAVIGQEGRLGPTPFAFGGCMVVGQEVMNNVPFDPKIPRGEDLDYVFNAMMSGYSFVMDRELWIKHLPPKSHVPDWMGFRINALRFTYARQKLRTQNPSAQTRLVDMEELEPYPGRFLGDDLDDKIFRTCQLLGQRYVEAGDTAAYRESMLTIELVEELKQREQDACAEYLELQSRWRRLMERLPHNPDAREILTR
jgi:hypothetical protein